MNKVLFGVIGILVLAIAGVALFGLPRISMPTPGSLAAGGVTGATTTPVVATTSPVTATTSSPQPTPSAPNTFTLAEVAKHNSRASCYTSISGNVYDVTTWINQHPGGPERILGLCGTDGTAAFTGQHSGQARPSAELASFKIGTLIQ